VKELGIYSGVTIAMGIISLAAYLVSILGIIPILLTDGSVVCVTVYSGIV